MGTASERSDFDTPDDGCCTYAGNTSLGQVDSAAERAAVRAYEQSVKAAGVVIGPRKPARG